VSARASARRSVVRLVPKRPAEADYAQLADGLLALADEVADAEDRIKVAAIEAIERGDAGAAAALLRRWRAEPPTAIAAGLGRQAGCA